MNRKNVFLLFAGISCILFLTKTAYGSDVPLFDVRFNLTSNINYTKNYTINNYEKDVAFNGIILTLENFIKASPHIKYIIHNRDNAVDSDNKKLTRCYAGNYDLIVITKKDRIKSTPENIYQEKGCMESKRFSNLINHFDSI